MEQRIILRPLAKIYNPLLEMLRESLRQTFHRAVEIKPQISRLGLAYISQRNQYLAPLLLSRLRDLGMKPGERYLDIVDVDLYSPGLNYIFGEADVRAGVAIISLYRLRQERYGLPHNERLFQERAIKEAVHELGHTYYLPHCSELKCVMHFSNSLAGTDKKGAVFCPKCQHRLQEMETG